MLRHPDGHEVFSFPFLSSEAPGTGSHTVYALMDRGGTVAMLDNLSTGVKAHVGKQATFFQDDVADTVLMKTIIAGHGVDAVIYFAGSIVVPESVAYPLTYYAGEESPRRPGDPPTLIADPTRTKAALGWTPRHDDLDEIIRSAIAWERRFNR